jgi:hypothetical protein
MYEHYDYDVALSFAGEDREYAEQLADCLARKNVRVFYDKYEKAELWGKDLYEYLATLYRDRAFYCVIFISTHYASKLWTTHERKNAQARAFRENREYILPIRLDDTELPGLPATIGYEDLRHTTIEDVCDLVLQKLSNPPMGQSELSGVIASVQFEDRASLDYVKINGAIIQRVFTGSTGTLVFTVDASSAPVWDTIAIYIPPGFRLPSVESQMSKDRPGIQVIKASRFDQYGPEWHVVYVPADTTTYGDAGIGPHHFLNPLIEVTSEKERYGIRIKGATAPFVAGRYLFKVALLLAESYGIPGSVGVGQPASRFILPQNWPILLVKGEVEPAAVTGTIRRASDKTAISEAGKVWTHMTMRINPYTGQQRPDLTKIDAVGYFDATAEGHYEVSGLAPGIYDLYVSATGFPQKLAVSGFTASRNQTLEFDCYLEPGPVVLGDLIADGPWPDNAFVKIELYENPTLSRKLDPSTRLVSWSPSRVAAAQKFSGRTRNPQDVGPPQRWQVLAGTTHSFHFAMGQKGKYGAPRDFDGMIPQLYATWVNGLTPGRYYTRAWVSRYNQSAEDGVTFLEYYFDVMPNMRDDVKLVIRLHGK